MAHRIWDVRLWWEFGATETEARGLAPEVGAGGFLDDSNINGPGLKALYF